MAKGPEPRSSHNSAIIGNELLVWAGRGPDYSFLPHNIIWSWNDRKSSWSKRTSTSERRDDVPCPSLHSRIAVFENHQIYQFGGCNCLKKFSNDLHMLDGLTLKWKRIRLKGAIPDARASCGLCILGDHLVLVGGEGEEPEFKDDTWVFSFAESCWSRLECKGKGPSRRKGHSFSAIDKICAVCFGGEDVSRVFSDSFLFKLDKKEWEKILFECGPGKPVPFSCHSAVCVDTREKGPCLFVMWGSDSLGSPACAVIMELKDKKSTKIDISGVVPISDQIALPLLMGNQLHFLLFGTCPGEEISKACFVKLVWDPRSFGNISVIDLCEASALVTELAELSLNDFSKFQFQRSEFEYDEEIDFIGGGGYGEVYKAKMKKTGETVALKVFFWKRHAKDESEYLNKEARVLLQIKPHPNILKFIGICETRRFYALLMEYISGGDLAQFLASDDPENKLWSNRLDIARQVALGMAHLHDNSPPIIHLDLKPANVLIEKRSKFEFVCKICDFGLAKMTVASSSEKKRSGKTIPSGTIAYIAPERYEAEPCGPGKGEEIAKKADVFSYGVVLWEIRERERPFRGLPSLAVHLHIESGGALPKGREAGPTGYDELVKDCSAFDPAQRPSFDTVIPRLDEVACIVQNQP